MIALAAAKNPAKTTAQPAPMRIAASNRSRAALSCWQRLLPSGRQSLFTAAAAGGRRQLLFGREFVAATAAVIAADPQLESLMWQHSAADMASALAAAHAASRPPLLLLPGGRPVTALSWPGHGSMLFWQLGVMDGLQQAWGAEQMRQLHLIGSSSGGLLAVLAACGVAPGQAISSAAALAAAARLQQRRLGLTGVCGRLLEDWLQQLLPVDAAARCSNRVTLLCTAMPWLYNVHVSSFATRDDVTAATLASAHIPWCMDGRLTARLVFPPLATEASAAAAAAARTGSNSCAGGGSAARSSSGEGDAGSRNPRSSRVSAWAAAGAATGGPAGAASSRAMYGAVTGTATAESSSDPNNSTAGIMQRLQHSRLWRTNRCIDGNWWMHVKSCYRGFAPADGSATLLLEPQQDEALPPLLQQLSPPGAAGKRSSRQRPARLPGLMLLSERQAWQLFEFGRAFAARAAAGDAACLIVRRRSERL